MSNVSRKLFSALIAASATSCGVENVDDQIVCFSIKFPFEDCRASSASFASDGQLDSGAEIPYYEDDWTVAKPLPMTLMEEFDGSAVIYDRNVNGGKVLVNFKLSRSGYLENSYLKSVPRNGEPAHSTSNHFEFDAASPEFRETSAFANAALMQRWFESLGHYTRPLQTTIETGAVINGDRNNAFYMPDSQGASRILIGDGDGESLKNLATDADIVSLQYAHSITTETIKTFTGEALELHAGIAAAFVALRFDDACLAPTVCTGSGNICMQRNQCLSNAENTLRFDRSLASYQEKYARISGSIWDLYKNGTFARNDLAKLLLTTVYNLPENPTYVSFAQTMIQVHRVFGNGQYESEILATFQNRGLPFSAPATTSRVGIWVTSPFARDRVIIGRSQSRSIVVAPVEVD